MCITCIQVSHRHRRNAHKAAVGVSDDLIRRWVVCHTAPVVENQLSKVAPGGPCGCRRFRWNFIFLKITDLWDVTMQLAPHPTRPYPKCLPPSELQMSYSSPNTSLKNIRFCKLLVARSSRTKTVCLLLRVSWELQIATFSPFRTSVMP
jgi:hypothetical protein